MALILPIGRFDYFSPTSFFGYVHFPMQRLDVGLNVLYMLQAIF